mmetsp:Transcript_24932/g.64709  ORF Transcript_24932/g.64709 Transcript_24932/m.64709 type:complete len:201 (-) Transcript_24932:1530-2132(-)
MPIGGMMMPPGGCCAPGLGGATSPVRVNSACTRPSSSSLWQIGGSSMWPPSKAKPAASWAPSICARRKGGGGGACAAASPRDDSSISRQQGSSISLDSRHTLPSSSRSWICRPWSFSRVVRRPGSSPASFNLAGGPATMTTSLEPAAPASMRTETLHPCSGRSLMLTFVCSANPSSQSLSTSRRRWSCAISGCGTSSPGW